MKTVTLRLGLTLTAAMHQGALEALRQIAPEHVAWLSWKNFTTNTYWCFMPDRTNPSPNVWARAELKIPGTPRDRDLKFIVWAQPEHENALPHNHQHDNCLLQFIAGSYEEYYIVQSLGSPYLSGWRHYRAGDTMVINRHTFHKIIAVAPGTFALFDTRGERHQKWGYFDGTMTKPLIHQPTAQFMECLAALNPNLGL